SLGWARRTDSIAVRNRERSCAAALRVKVTAAILSMEHFWPTTSATIRLTRHVVFPVPAAASTNIVESSSSTMRRRSALSGGRAYSHQRPVSFGEAIQLLNSRNGARIVLSKFANFCLLCAVTL